MTNFEKVKEFCEKFEHDAPSFLWLKLIEEEFEELLIAWQGHNSDPFEARNEPFDNIETLDAICDLLYVTYGLAHSLGWNADGAFQEVHRSNMTKLGEDGKPIKREDGKIMKGLNYDPPHLERFITNA